MSLTAVFGGTFNPLHIGHYQMLSVLEKNDKIDEILILPDKIPPHKVCDFLADDADRIEMCRLVCEDFSKAKVSLIEFERQGKSYTYDTVLALKEKHKDKNFIFVCGGDMITSLDKWYCFEKLITEIPFIAFKRNDISDEVFFGKIRELIDKGADITVFEDEITAVSSTVIRRNVEGNKHLLPEKIYKFIKLRGLYESGL